MADAAPRDIVLVHSPLVGPSSLAPTAASLERRGYRSYTPCLVGSDTAWRDAPGAVTAALPQLERPVLIGHSAAGLLLPALAARLGAWALVFLDAQIPPATGPAAPADAEFARFVETLPVEQGRLPKWSHWWGPHGLDGLFPDLAAQEAFEADLPRLRPEWWRDAVEVPPWAHLRAGYVQTSAVYAPQAAKARESGWPVASLAGTHLHPFLAPGDTALAIAEVLTALAGR